MEMMRGCNPFGGVSTNKMANLYEHKDSPYSSHGQLLAMLPASGAGLQLLDVGCWDGAVSNLYLARGFQVTGIEQTRHATVPPGLNLIEANLHQGLPPIDGLFDYIICADVLEHLLQPGEVLRQLKTKLKPGGVLVASLPNSGHWYFRAIVLAGRFPKDENGLFDKTHLHFFTWDGWRDLFAQSGYTIERIKPTSIPVSRVLPTWSRTLTVGVGERLNYWFACVWMKLFAYQFVICAKGK